MQGFKASYGDLDPDFGPYPRAVIWREADDRWFRVSCDLGQAGILRLAEAVRAGSNPMRLPFRLESIPDGVSMVQLVESTENAITENTVPTTSAGFEMAGSRGPLHMEISNITDSVLTQGKAERRKIGDYEVEIRALSQSICFPTKSQTICISGPGGEPASDWSPEARAVAFRTAELLSPVDNPEDESHWLDAGQALPPK